MIFMLISAMALGQEKTIIRGNQQWVQHYQQFGLGNGFTAAVDGGFRWRDGLSEKSQYLVRMGLLYQLLSNVQIGGGIAYGGLFLDDDISVREFRIYQEINHRIPLGKSGFSHRFRLEERFFHNNINDLNRFSWRFRYALQFNIFITSLGSNGQALLLNIGDEIFLNTGKDIIYNAFDQNRFIVGPSFRLPSNWTVGLSYNYQYGAVNTEATYFQNHVFWLTSRHTIDLRRSQ